MVVSLTDTLRYPLPLLFLRLFFSQIHFLQFPVAVLKHFPPVSMSWQPVLYSQRMCPMFGPCLLKLMVHAALETTWLTISYHHQCILLPVSVSSENICPLVPAPVESCIDTLHIRGQSQAAEFLWIAPVQVAG